MDNVSTHSVYVCMVNTRCLFYGAMMGANTAYTRGSRRLVIGQTWLRIEECIMGLDDDFTHPAAYEKHGVL